MLNKNANCYNIEKNFKYSTVISAFSKHITIFRTLSIDIWQLKCQQRQTNTTKNCKLLRIIKFFFLILLRKATLLTSSKIAPTNRNSSAFLLNTSKAFSNIELFPIFSQTFLKLIFATKIKTMLLKQSSVLLTSCQKNIAYILYTNQRILP